MTILLVVTGTETEFIANLDYHLHLLSLPIIAQFLLCLALIVDKEARSLAFVYYLFVVSFPLSFFILFSDSLANILPRGGFILESVYNIVILAITHVAPLVVIGKYTDLEF